MQPTYPYLPGTIENDWRNVIYGSLAGAAPSNAIGVDGNYFADIDTAKIWGPKTASVWAGPAASLFHDVNVIFGATNGAAPSNNLGVNGDIFVDYQTSSVFGPKANGVWPGTPVSYLIGPANVIYGNSSGAVPSNTLGNNGFYYFDTSTSRWYGPKASNAWPPTPVPVAGGVNMIVGNSGGISPGNSIGIIGSYYYDTIGQLYYGPKTNTGWPTTGSSLSPTPSYDANTVTGPASGHAPSNTAGHDGEYFLDSNSGKIWGAKSGGAWPVAPSFSPYVAPDVGTTPPPTTGGETTVDSNTITGSSSGAYPSSTIGIDGDYFFDADSGQIFGPKAGGLWPHTPVWISYHPAQTIAQNNWPRYTTVRGIYCSTLAMHLFDKLTVSHVFGCVVPTNTTTVVSDTAPLGGNALSMVGFNSNTSFLGPWGAFNAGSVPMAVGQIWQVVGIDALVGIDPATGAVPSSMVAFFDVTAQVPWGYASAMATPPVHTTSGIPIHAYFYNVDNSVRIDGIMVGITLMRMS